MRLTRARNSILRMNIKRCFSALLVTILVVLAGCGIYLSRASAWVTSAPNITQTISAPRLLYLPIAHANTPALIGSQGILRVSANPIGKNSTVYATWNIPNFRDGEFDKGDGRGYIGPIASAMTVDVPNISEPRQLKLRWRDTNGQQTEDLLPLSVLGSTATPARAVCDASNPDWRGNSNAAYAFCVKQDLSWADNGSPVRSFPVGSDVMLTAVWNIYGINGIRFVVEPSAQQCAPQGTSVINEAVNGNGSYSFNVKQLSYGGYIVHLQVTRRDNAVVNYNEKFLCIGTEQPTEVQTPVPTQLPPTPIPTGGVGTPATPIP